MHNHPLYPNARPFEADVLILCEGDAVGYETELLKLWADREFNAGPFVKAVACGTAEALYGVADAVGRTMPILVVEDRDFRSPEEARADCEKKLKNREGRNAAMRGWIAWSRAEIENYFTDDVVLPTVFADAFACSEGDVREAVRSALELLPPAQSLDCARYRVRKTWTKTDPVLQFRIDAVEWTATGRSRWDAKRVRKKLEDRLKRWQKSLHDGEAWKDPLAGRELLDNFDAKCKEWSGLAYEDLSWRRDWAGKEVVKHVRMSLAQSKPGWWSLPNAPGAPVDWFALNDDKARDAHDRKIERVLQPKLVKAALAAVTSGNASDLKADLDKLAELIRKQ